MKKRRILPLQGIETRPSSPLPIAISTEISWLFSDLTARRTEINILNKKGERLVHVECMGERF
jgi:hypothetical protein